MPYDENTTHDQNTHDENAHDDRSRAAEGRSHADHDDAARSIEVLEAVERESHRLLGQADRLVRALAARASLDPAAFRCLHLLDRQGPLSMRRLSALTGLGPDTTLAAVDALEAAALARRCRGVEGCDDDQCLGDARATGRRSTDPYGADDRCPGEERVTGRRRTNRYRADRRGTDRCDIVRADHEACRARIGPALRELREAWYPLVAGRRDDLALVTSVLADGRRLSELVPTLG